MYVYDSDNHPIQMFDLDLNSIKSIGSHGKGRGEFDAPYDVKFDTKGNAYIVELNSAIKQECKYWTLVAVSYEGLVRKERENYVDHQHFILLTITCMCPITEVNVL